MRLNKNLLLASICLLIAGIPLITGIYLFGYVESLYVLPSWFVAYFIGSTIIGYLGMVWFLAMYAVEKFD